MTRPINTLLFGGTFDPPHLAHKDIINILILSFPKIPLRILPSYDPPKQIGVLKNPSATYEHRIKMLQIMLQDIAPKGLSIDTIEQTLPSPNYTYQTLEHYYKVSHDFYPAIAIGMDQFRRLHQWARADYLLQNAHFIVLNRNSEPIAVLDEILQVIEQHFSLKFEKIGPHFYEQKACGFSIQMLEQEVRRCESETIRVALTRNDKALLEAYLDPNVLDYIKENHLYEQ